MTEDNDLGNGPEREEQFLKNEDGKFLIHVTPTEGVEIFIISVTFQKLGDLKQKRE